MARELKGLWGDVGPLETVQRLRAWVEHQMAWKEEKHKFGITPQLCVKSRSLCLTFPTEEGQEILYQIKSLAALEKITESLQKALGKVNCGPPSDQ